MVPKRDKIWFIITGPHKVGKTEIIFNFCNITEKKQYTYYSEVDTYLKPVNLQNHSYYLCIMDLNYLEQNSQLFLLRLENLIIMHVYSTSNRKSFQHAINGYTLYHNHLEKKEKKTEILVGNSSFEQREVSYEEGKGFADSVGILFYEVNPKTDENINECFFNAVYHCIQKKTYRNVNEIVVNKLVNSRKNRCGCILI